MSNKNKLLYIIICMALLIIIIGLVFFYRAIPVSTSDYCIEDGDCPEGAVIKINNKNFTVTQKSCVSNYGIWNEDRKECKLDFIRLYKNN